MADALKERGNTAFRTHRYQLAAKFYTKAAETSPDQAVHRSNLAAALIASGNYRAAAQEAATGLQCDQCSDGIRGKLRVGRLFLSIVLGACARAFRLQSSDSGRELGASLVRLGRARFYSGDYAGTVQILGEVESGSLPPSEEALLEAAVAYTQLAQPARGTMEPDPKHSAVADTPAASMPPSETTDGASRVNAPALGTQGVSRDMPAQRKKQVGAVPFDPPVRPSAVREFGSYYGLGHSDVIPPFEVEVYTAKAQAVFDRQMYARLRGEPIPRVPESETYNPLQRVVGIPLRARIAAGEHVELAFFFGGAGDCRQVFGAMASLFRQLTALKKDGTIAPGAPPPLTVRMMVVDRDPTIVARALVLFQLLFEYSNELCIPPPQVDGEAPPTNTETDAHFRSFEQLTFVVNTYFNPVVCPDTAEAISAAVDETLDNGMDLPWGGVYGDPATHATVVNEVKRWKEHCPTAQEMWHYMEPTPYDPKSVEGQYTAYNIDMDGREFALLESRYAHFRVTYELDGFDDDFDAAVNKVVGAKNLSKLVPLFKKRILPILKPNPTFYFTDFRSGTGTKQTEDPPSTYCNLLGGRAKLGKEAEERQDPVDDERSYGHIEDALSPLFTDAAQLLDALPVEYRFYCNDMHVAASEYSRSDAGHGVKCVLPAVT